MMHMNERFEHREYRFAAFSRSIFAALILTGCGGGADDRQPGTFPAHIEPTQPSYYSCGATGPATDQLMASINAFWQSRVKACACEADAYAAGACAHNAFVLGQSLGYIYYDPNFLAELGANGSTLPPEWLMAHEFGHNIQITLNLPNSGGKYHELQADCLAGFYVGWRVKEGAVGQGDVTATLRAACGIADPIVSPWWEPNAHGVCEERVQAVQAGINGYLSGALPGQACPYG